MSTPQVDPGIDEALVRQLLTRQFPVWAELPLQAVGAAGTDNALFRLGDELAVRMPKRASAAPQAEREHRWLPMFAPRLPLAIPVPLAAGRPDEHYPWSWSILPWIPGADAASAPISDLFQAARDLGAFLQAFKRIEADGGPVAGHANSGRGVPLALLDKRVRADVAALSGEIDGAAILDAWEEALVAPVHSSAGTWVHGDLHASNLLVRDGQLVAVLDFGLLGVGDPACDLLVAWSVLDAESRDVFREVVGADEAAWLRGRGWAIFSAIIALAFYRGTNPTLCAMSTRTLTEVLQ